MSNDSHVFKGITDPRSRNATRHDLHEMLMMDLLTVLSGGETCTDMAPFGWTFTSIRQGHIGEPNIALSQPRLLVRNLETPG